MSRYAIALLTALCLLLPAGSAVAQTAPDDDGWRISIYPVLAWIPSGIDIDLSLPPSDVDGGFAGEIVESRFDGAFLAGFSVDKAGWRLDFDGMWAAVGGDREQRPTFSVDADVIYFHVTGGRKIVKDLYATAGVRRFALKYVIDVDAVGVFERKPGVWDPIVGLAWHTQRPKYEVHALFEGGGFGAGSDVELATSFRADWKPIPHFGITAGYQFLYFKIEDERRGRALQVKQTLQGPIVGIGFYF
jgi:hypothetical protein